MINIKRGKESSKPSSLMTLEHPHIDLKQLIITSVRGDVQLQNDLHIQSIRSRINKDKDSQDRKQQQKISSTVSYNNSESTEPEKDSTSDEEEQSEGNNDILNEKMLNAQTKGDEDFDTFILNNLKSFDGCSRNGEENRFYCCRKDEEDGGLSEKRYRSIADNTTNVTDETDNTDEEDPRSKFNFNTHSCLQPTDLENYVLDQKTVSLAPAEKENLIRNVLAARLFDHHLRAFLRMFIANGTRLDIQDIFVRLQAQMRGTMHAHMSLWIKNAPRYGEKLRIINAAMNELEDERELTWADFDG
ncbi:unnamed protein product [Didymodactylos carnosus]|uniref:Uncharacterized protein n=1 Tax=Didymodactylos carnosus TaxID=1234261 RepID=A0A8S2I923_9BILA|nr:unnamed protein product [Didymodactylos carnosus]CAF3716720.1 unnamed protein product [Didymodactylos carnosus]